MQRGRIALLALLAAAFTLLAVQAGQAAHKPPKKHHPPKKHKPHKPKPPKAMNASQKLAHVQHVVVIYEENHSFDNLWGGWEGVNGRSNADAVPVVVSVHVAGSATRLTSFCIRHV